MKQQLTTSIVFTVMFAAIMLTPGLIHAVNQPSPAAAETINGTIRETMSGAGYTYVRLDTADGSVWAAIPEHEVHIGDTISLLPGMVMKDFHSSTFDRTFAAIVFSAGIADTPVTAPIAGKQEVPAPDPSFAAAVAAEKGTPEQERSPIPMSGGSMAAMAPFIDVKVPKATGDNGYAVAEVFAKAAELNGTVIRVRGQVVKYRTKIMGKNWVHLQDGTGDPLQGSHDLVVTTNQEVEENKVVTMEGTVTTDRDFGAGYTYAVLIEQATIVND